MELIMAASNSATVTVSSKGWVVIPAPLRKKINLKPGMKMIVKEVEGKIVLEPQASDRVDLFFGKLAGKESLTQALLKEKAQDEKREKARFCS